MTGVAMELKVGNTPDALMRVLAAASDLTPALKNIGVHVTQSTKERIVEGVSPDGKPFTPLNPLYAETKKGPGILRGESGSLAEIVWQLGGADSVEIGNNVIYGAIHQFGGVIKAKNAPALIFSMGGQHFAVKSVTIPARPYLGLSQDDEAEIVAIIADHFGAQADQ